MTLEQQVLEILYSDKTEEWERRGLIVKVTEIFNERLGKGFQLRCYEPQERDRFDLSFQKLRMFGELFGTDEINVDNYGTCGCSTCDWGWEAGHDIQLYQVTKLGTELMAACSEEK